MYDDYEMLALLGGHTHLPNLVHKAKEHLNARHDVIAGALT